MSATSPISNGVHIFKEFARIVGEKGEGTVPYLWPKTQGAAPSPKISYVKGFKPWGWVVGSGLYVDDVDALFWQQVRNLALVLGGLLVALVGGGFVIARGISLPLGTISNRMRALAGGDKTIDVPYAEKRDEIGDLARALDVFKSQALEMDRLRDEQEAMRVQAERDKHAAMERLADEFETTVGVIVSAVGSGATQMRDTANGMAQTAEQTSRQATTVAAASEEATANVQTVAAATEELSSSIAEISRQVASPPRSRRRAVDEAERTNGKVQGLAEAAQKIGEVVT